MCEILTGPSIIINYLLLCMALPSNSFRFHYNISSWSSCDSVLSHSEVKWNFLFTQTISFGILTHYLIAFSHDDETWSIHLYLTGQRERFTLYGTWCLNYKTNRHMRFFLLHHSCDARAERELKLECLCEKKESTLLRALFFIVPIKMWGTHTLSDYGDKNCMYKDK